MRKAYQLWTAAVVAADAIVNAQTTPHAGSKSTTDSAVCEQLLDRQQWVGLVSGMGDSADNINKVTFGWEASGRRRYDPVSARLPYWARFNVTGTNSSGCEHNYGYMVIQGIPDKERCFLEAVQDVLHNPYINGVDYNGTLSSDGGGMDLESLLPVEPWANQTVWINVDGTPYPTTVSPVTAPGLRPTSLAPRPNVPATTKIADAGETPVSIVIICVLMGLLGFTFSLIGAYSCCKEALAERERQQSGGADSNARTESLLPTGTPVPASASSHVLTATHASGELAPGDVLPYYVPPPAPISTSVEPVKLGL